MPYLGDVSSGSTLVFFFTTVDSTGPAAALSSAAVVAFAEDSTDNTSSGITLTASYAGVTGMNRVLISMESASPFYVPGKTYAAVISSGGAGGESLAGYVVGQWSIRDRFAQVTTAVTISTATSIDGVTTVNGNVTGNVTGTVGGLGSTASSDVRIACSSALALYDGPTHAEVNANSTATDALINTNATATDALIGGLNDLASSDVTVPLNANSTATDALIGALNDISSTDVNDQVLDVLTVDSQGEQTGVPPASTSLTAKIDRMYMAMRGQVIVSSSAKTFYDSSGNLLFGKQLTQDSTSSTGVYTEALASTST